jgi:hypothetical protein
MATVTHVDAGTAAVVGALLGGVLTIVGGLLGTLVLARLEQGRQERRQRERHVTAVRIVVLELQGNGAALISLEQGIKHHPMSMAGYLSVAPDLYSLLPESLATDVAYAYTIATWDVQPDAAEELLLKVMSILTALREYGQKELGLDLPIRGPASSVSFHAGRSADTPKG